MENRFSIGCNAISIGVTFGAWQSNFCAGVFATIACIFVATIADEVIKAIKSSK